MRRVYPGVPIEATGGEARRSRLWWKRPLDLVLGTLALALGSLPILALALAVMIDSRGRPFFAQERVGRGGRSFRMWKLRTMHERCDQSPHERAAADWFAGRTNGSGYKTLTDPRITRIGRWLRRLSIDELPQLLNVVRGDMSLVGPRPAIPYELPLYEPAYFARLDVPPGMTGLWQVTRRERLSAAEMMHLDLRYVREASPWLDLKILAMTPAALLAAALGRT